jgi:LPXTG-motif cell wall-anchored protein
VRRTNSPPLFGPDVLNFSPCNKSTGNILDMFPVWIGFLIVGALLLVFRRRKRSRYHPGVPIHQMEAVSSSMLLSEVDPENNAQVTIVTLLIFEEKLQYEHFRERFVENVIQTDPDSRFLYRLDCSFQTPRWIKATDWHPFDNFVCISDQQDIESCKNLMSTRMTDPLDVRKPVWECAFIDTFITSESASVSAVILTMHHSMGDGFTLCHQLMRRAIPADPGITMHDCYPFQAPSASPSRSWADSFMRRFHLLQGFISSAAKLLLLQPDPISPLRNSTRRRLDDLIVCDISLLDLTVNDLKKIAKDATEYFKRDTRISINDVVVAAISLAFQEVLGEKHRHDITSAIWVGLNRKSVIDRPRNRCDDWGNQNLGVSYLNLPTGDDKLQSPDKMLLECHKRLCDMKSSPEPIVANGLLKVLGSVPFWCIWPFRYLLMDKMSASISNFPGPTKRIRLPASLEGETGPGVGTLKEVYFTVAPPFSYGPYVTMASYNGRMQLAITIAEKLMPEETVQEIVRHKIPKSFRSIAQVVRRQ